MTVYANGFLAYHIEVAVKVGLAESVKAAIKDWQGEFRELGIWPGFPDSMIERLRAVPGVERVECEGPQSSLLIPLRMVKGITGLACSFSAILGKGSVTNAIVDALNNWGIRLERAGRLNGLDSPIEFSIRDPDGGYASLVLYPAGRRRYTGFAKEPADCPGHMILNRYNKTLRGIAQRVYDAGGLVSFRPRELGRYDSIEDYAALLPFTSQIVLSSRHGVMKNFAKLAGLEVPHGWPENVSSLSEIRGTQLASWLLERIRPGGIIVLHQYRGGDAGFYSARHPPVVVRAPAGYGSESRTARIQGALLGTTLENDGCLSIVKDTASWQHCCEAVVAEAYRGTDTRPWRYPNHTKNLSAF